MRHWILIPAALVVAACTLYPGGGTEHTPHTGVPDARIDNPDGGSYMDGCSGNHDGGGYLPDAGSFDDGGGWGTPDGGGWGLPDADGYGGADGGGWGTPDAGP